MTPAKGSALQMNIKLFAQTWLRRLAHSGWPVWVGLLAFGSGVLLLLAAWGYAAQAESERRSAEPTRQSEGNRSTGHLARASQAVIAIPGEEVELEDLRQLLRIAKSNEVQVASIDYRREPLTGLGMVVHTLDLRTREDYPTLKRFLADLLGHMPHLSLQDLRVERPNASAAQAQVLLKLALVYRLRANNTSAISLPGN